MAPRPPFDPDTRRERRYPLALNRPVAMLLLLQLMGGMILSPQRTFFPIYLKELGFSALFIAALVAVQQAMGLVASWVGGSLSDSLGRKKTLLLGQVGPLASGLAFFARSAYAIGPLRALGGFCGGLHTVGAQTYLLDSAQPEHLGVLAALFNWGYTLGGALSSPLVGFLLHRWDYTLLGASMIVGALVTIGLTQSALPRYGLVSGRSVSSHKALSNYRDIVAHPSVVVLACLRFLPTFYWGMSLVLVPLLLDDAGATKIAIALYATVSQVAASLGQIAVGRISDRVGPKWPTVTAFSFLVVSILCVGYLPDVLWALYLFASMAATAAWSLSTLMPSLVARVAEAQTRGRVLGWIHLWWNLGMVTGSIVGGALFEGSQGLPFLVAGALNLISIALAFLFFHKIDRRQ